MSLYNICWHPIAWWECDYILGIAQSSRLTSLAVPWSLQWHTHTQLIKPIERSLEPIVWMQRRTLINSLTDWPYGVVPLFPVGKDWCSAVSCSQQSRNIDPFFTTCGKTTWPHLHIPTIQTSRPVTHAKRKNITINMNIQIFYFSFKVVLFAHMSALSSSIHRGTANKMLPIRSGKKSLTMMCHQHAAFITAQQLEYSLPSASRIFC